MDQKTPRRIDGSGVLILVVDEISQQTFALLGVTIRHSGIFVQDLGGILSSESTEQANACKEVFEESCSSLFIEHKCLDHSQSLIASGRYRCFVVWVQADCTALKEQLTNIYRENRKQLFEAYQQSSKDHHLKCFLETNRLELIELDQILKGIESRPHGKDVFLNLNNQQIELHRRTQAICREYRARGLVPNKTFSLQLRMLSQRQTYIKKLWGKYCLNLQENQAKPAQLMEQIKVEKLDGSGCSIFIVDQGIYYVLLFLNHKRAGDFIVDPGGSCKDGNIFGNAIKETFEETCMSITVGNEAIQENFSVVASNRYRSYGVLIEMSPQFTQLRSLYCNNRDELIGVRQRGGANLKSYLETSDFFIVALDLIDDMLKSGKFEIVSSGRAIPFHTRTIEVFQAFKSRFSFDLNGIKARQTTIDTIDGTMGPQLDGHQTIRIL